MRVVFSGMVAGVPGHGGATWAVLQYVLGLRRLGHEVVLIEPVATEPSPRTCSYFRHVVAQFGLEGSAALLVAGTRQTLGVPYPQLVELGRGAELLLNVAGMLSDDQITGAIRRRVYLDLDPAFVQLWHIQGIDARFAGHTHHVTVGLAVASPGCAVPTCGLHWVPTLQPVVLEDWPFAGEVARDALTTVANWRGYGSIHHDGAFYGQKAHSLRELLTLPRLTDERFELALAIHPDEERDLRALHENGWRLVDPAEVAGTPGHYRQFVQGSKAELGLAKSGYVASRSGWFSDRSACYLASGRPVVAQDTGFGCRLPVGEGLFAFTTADDVLRAIEELRRDYGRHRRAARAIAEEHFDSDVVLERLLERVGAG